MCVCAYVYFMCLCARVYISNVYRCTCVCGCICASVYFMCLCGTRVHVRGYAYVRMYYVYRSICYN